jgi:hypothetical protein
MKDKPKKKKNPTDKPSLPIPRDWKKLVLDDPDVDVLKIEEDTMALQVGNKPSMEELVASAQSGDDKSFLALIKIHTFIHPFDSKEGSKLIIPTISADCNFYGQEWVQKKLKSGMENKQFEKNFYKAVSSRQNATLFKRTTEAQAEFKKYVVSRRDEWLEKNNTLEDIEQELIKYGLIKEKTYADVESLRKILNRYGFKRNPD